RDTEEGRTVNREDIRILENIYPEYYEDYIEACPRMQQTWTRRLSYADLFEKSATTTRSLPFKFVIDLVLSISSLSTVYDVHISEEIKNDKDGDQKETLRLIKSLALTMLPTEMTMIIHQCILGDNIKIIEYCLDNLYEPRLLRHLYDVHISEEIKNDKDGDQKETLRLIKSLALTMLPTEMTMIIHQCILGDNIKIIEYCLDNLYEPRLLRHCSWEGTNLVHLAIESGSVKAVETILSREINDINATDGKGQNALLIAYKTNNYNKMNLLLRYGADETFRHFRKIEALLINTEYGITFRYDKLCDTKIKHFYYDGSKKVSQLIVPIEWIVRLIKSLTPTMLLTEITMIIHQCILGDNIKIIEYCLDNLYEPRLLRHCSWEGTNLVHLAVESESVKAVETILLIKSLALTMLPTEMTMIIHQCILGDNIKIIEYCLDNLYEPRLLRHCSWEGTNLVHLAIESGSVKAVETILSREINDINATDGKGQNALLIAYKTNNYNKMNLLLRYGAEFYPRQSYMRYITDRRPPGSTSQFIVYCLAREISEKRFVNPDDLRAL
ncbi:hypothetical protein TSAR_008251, partial [Trichomalopsis sarcophagae]